MNELLALGRLPALALQERAIRAGVEMIPMPGAPVLAMPPHIVAAVESASELPWGRESAGTPELRAALSRMLSRGGVSVDPDGEILVTHGASQALSVVLGALLSRGDQVVVPVPAYFFDGAIVRAGGEPVHVPCDPDRGWALDLDRIESALTSRSRAILICNPVNPTGRLHTSAEIDALVALAERRGLYVISDESFSDYVYDGAHIPLMSRRSDSDRLIAIQSLSKNYAFASWRIGYVIAGMELLERIKICFEWDSINVGPVPQAAAVAALENDRSWLDQELQQYRGKRDVLVRAVRSAGFETVRPQAGAGLLADLSTLGMAGMGLESLLLEHRIAALTGDAFGGPADHVRLMFGGTFKEIEALGAALQDIAGCTIPDPQKGSTL